MTEIDALKYELEQERQAFDKLHRKYLELLKQQGELEKENKELKQKIESLKMEIAELRESEKDNYNITDGLW